MKVLEDQANGLVGKEKEAIKNEMRVCVCVREAVREWKRQRESVRRQGMHKINPL